MATAIKAKTPEKAPSPLGRGRVAQPKKAPNGEIIPEGHRWSEKDQKIVPGQKRTLPDGTLPPKGHRWDKKLGKLVKVTRKSPTDLVKALEARKVEIMEKAQADIDKIDARLEGARVRFRKRLTADEALKELEAAGKTPQAALDEYKAEMEKLKLKMKAIRGALPDSEE